MNFAWMDEAAHARSGAFERAMRVLPSAEIAAKPAYDKSKRTFDLVLGALAAVVAALPMLAIALAVKLDSPGPALYRQERLGLDGKPFTLLKFRSMRQDAERDGPRWAEKYDPRVTRVGRVLRKTRMDELPQLWNILRGEMSFVGPRPERKYFYAAFEERLPGFSRRMAVKPGLTGWAQVNGGYDLQPPDKLVYDMEYIRKRSLALDARCLFMTVRIVLGGHGAR